MHSGFKGSTSYLICCCGMCSFGILEPVPAPQLLLLHPRLWKCNYPLVVATPTFYTKTVNFLASAENLSICSKSTVAFCWGMTTTLRFLSNGFAGPSTKGHYDKNAILCMLHWKHCCCSFMLGIHIPFWARTSPAALWASAANLPSLLIFWQGCIGIWCPHLQLLNHWPFWVPCRSSGNCNAIRLQTLCWHCKFINSPHQDPQVYNLSNIVLLATLLGLIHQKAALASLNFPSLVLGELSTLHMGDLTISNIAMTLPCAWRSTPQT